MQGPVINGLFNTKWYNGQPLTQDQFGYVLFENKILGLPRLRQLRVNSWLISFESFYYVFFSY